MTTAIEALNVSFSYEKTSILHAVSFAVQTGEFFIMIGPNGSGKTTLMKILAGILPTRGMLQVDGRPMEAFSGKDLARHIAFVPQQLPADFPFMVQDVVAMGRSPHQGILGLTGDTDLEIVERAMQFTHVTDLAHRRLARLSGGELQRVFIARALCQEPQIIFLDEPTAFLDMAHQIQVMDLLVRLKQEKQMTVVMISHDINLAAMYGERLLLLKQGRVVHVGTPDAVLTFETLEEAYGCCVLVDRNPLGDFPRIMPVPGRLLPKHKARET
jgi:iron complex transport system ATP-binding protein